MTWKYIAGFFDGEGSLTFNGKGFRITISQTNKVVLEKIQKFTGKGKIFETYKRQKHWKDAWVYYIAKQEDVYYFLINTQKFLVVKAELVKKIMPSLKKIIDDQKIKSKKRERTALQVKKLREQGLTYRQIGKKLEVDYGYARRLVLKK
ncbi:MAG: LAGLIDADG family homing endonuclease [Patescibacteria group bacterium]